MQNQFEDEADVKAFISLLVKELDQVMDDKSEEDTINSIVTNLLNYASIFEASLKVVLYKLSETYRPSSRLSLLHVIDRLVKKY